MIALQVRGGPEPYMISSWIQILRVRSTDAGIYSCTVVSKKGIVRAEATVQVPKVSNIDLKVQGNKYKSVHSSQMAWMIRLNKRYSVSSVCIKELLIRVTRFFLKENQNFTDVCQVVIISNVFRP